MQIRLVENFYCSLVILVKSTRCFCSLWTCFVDLPTWLAQLDLYLLSQKWKELVEKARAKQLQPHEYNSGFHFYHLFALFSVFNRG